MTDWITATGEVATPTSNLAGNSQRGGINSVVGTRNHLEVKTNADDGPTVVCNASHEYTAGNDRPTSGSVMGTVRASHGGELIGRNPTGKDRVTVGGMETSIDAAVYIGALVRNPDGSFSDAMPSSTIKDPTDGMVPPKVAESAPDGAAEAFNIGDEAETAMTAIMGSVLPGDAIKAMDEVLYSGDVSANTLARMASQAGVEPDAMQEQIGEAWSGFYEATLDRFDEAGISEEALENLMAADPHAVGKLTEAARALVVSNDTSGIDDIRDQVLEQADRLMPLEAREALTAAGYDWEEDGKGGLRVGVSGTMVSFRVAVRQRVITFS